MQKPLAVAAFSTSIALAIVIGCSAPSPDGSAIYRTRGPSSGSDTTLEGGPASPSGSANNCANHEKVDDRPACDQCARVSCCDQVVACDKSPDCKAMVKCLDECKGDLACGLTCNIAHEKGAGVLQDLAGCAQDKCAKECPSTAPDGGGDLGDAF